MFKRNTIRSGAKWALASLIALATVTASAEGHIEARLQAAHPGQPGAKVVLTITNTGDAPVHIMAWETPLPAAGGRLGRSIFNVTDKDGKQVRYRGTWVNLGRLTMESFMVVSPGEVLSKEVDIASEYAFEPNQTYTVGYDMNLSHRPDASVVSSAEWASYLKPSQGHARAEPITIHFGDVVARAVAGSSAADLTCTTEQDLKIANANNEVTRHIYSAEQFMRDRYEAYLENGKVRYRFKAHPRYARWFGAHDDSEPEIHSAEWGLNNNARVYETVMATSKRYAAGGVTSFCGCPGFRPDVAAHVEDDSTYTIYYCDKFFTLPIFDAAGSQAGSIMHEFTHYNAHYPGTGDYVYGYADSEDLARKDRAKAVLNADNFEYFYTDTRPYDE